jgi:uncharacterized membrane protein YfcA
VLTGKLLVLAAIFFFLTSLVSVVSGSTSLITVPVMIALGIEAHVAVATNMMALTFMSVGGSLPFMGKDVLSRNRLVPSIILTVIGSGAGAFLLLSVPLNRGWCERIRCEEQRQHELIPMLRKTVSEHMRT